MCALGSGTTLAPEPSAPGAWRPVLSTPPSVLLPSPVLSTPRSSTPPPRVSWAVHQVPVCTPKAPRVRPAGWLRMHLALGGGVTKAPVSLVRAMNDIIPLEPSPWCFSLLQCRSSTGASLPAFGPLSSTPRSALEHLCLPTVSSLFPYPPRPTASLPSSSSPIFPVPSSLSPHLRSSSAQILRKSPFR